MTVEKKVRWNLIRRTNQIAPSGSRLQKCQRVPVGKKIGVAKNKMGTHSYVGLTQCGNAWACPICSQNLAVRRADIARIVHWNVNRKAVMITYTIQHSKGESLNALLNTLTMCHRVARTGRRLAAYNDLCLGYISAKEITYGHNGWHPHMHEVNYLHSDIDLARIETTLVRNYKKALVASGRIVNEITVKIDKWDGSTDYLTKGAGLSAELALGHMKSGNKSLNIYDILQRSRPANKWSDLYLEYYHSTHRRKVVNYSRSLDYLRSQASKKVDENREKFLEDREIVHTFDHETWRSVCEEGVRYNILATLDGEPV